MGQILNRVFRVAKSYMNDSETNSSHVDIDKDDELKRIIDELNNSEKKQEERKKEYNSVKMNLHEAFAVLNINQNAQVEEIKSAYKNKIKEYHPDRLENFGDELKELARKKTQDINEAYSIIRNSRGF